MEVVEAVEVLEVVEEIEEVEVEEGVEEDVEREVEDAEEVQAVEVEVEGVFVVLPQSPGHLWGSACGSPGIDWFPQILRNGHRCLRMRSKDHASCLWIVPEVHFLASFSDQLFQAYFGDHTVS